MTPHIVHLQCVAVLTVLCIDLFDFSLLEVAALPATTSAPTTHIVSFLRQKQQSNSKLKYNEYPDFDFDGTKHNPSEIRAERELDKLAFELDNEIDNNVPITETSHNLSNLNTTDDLLTNKQNTLENTDGLFGKNDRPDAIATDAPVNDGGLNLSIRVKQSIPVLEPVKHLVNTVADGGFNHTAHAKNHHRHHHLNGEHHEESAAIETEEEREQVSDSTEFQILDVLGTIGGMLWGFLSNLQKFFGSAISASSSSSSGGN